MLSVVCWKWKPHAGYRSHYGPAQVNILRSMVRRHYQRPHRFICVTDDASGIDSDIEIVPLWNDYSQLPNPHGPKNPSCYRRLRMFHPDIGQVFGDRFVSMDLDMLVTGDLRPVLDRHEDFVAYGDTNPRTHYNGSMILMTAGARAKVWETFDPETSPRKSKAAGFWGSDQGWISYCLGAGEARWTPTEGVYSYRNHIQRTKMLPQNARLVVFHGCVDPWSREAQNLMWVQQHYH